MSFPLVPRPLLPWWNRTGVAFIVWKQDTMQSEGVPVEGIHDPSTQKENIASNITELIGWSPLVELKNIASKEGALARIVEEARVAPTPQFCQGPHRTSG
ncbi:hypothetical protein GOP47_0008312 [Adiantum capillus-veneris]|uniref:Uncharacterized protein n=1 Tax=Adiantum capillus-veneris TaxID=13818 RepID=A0A9D4UYT7_ADICA|nr:hypothetical protein GOP47_0008312 [Adiantum capillus-veneris]